MPNVLELLYALKGSYSGAFVLFWGSMLIAWAGLCVVERRKDRLWIQLEYVVFWVFALAMVVFAALRPIGIARDDLAYLNIYNMVCPTLSCGQWVQGARDWGWYSLVGILKSYWGDPRVILLISAAGLLAKLWIVFKLSRRPMLALLFFAGVFYQVQDLVTFRVSMSMVCFMVSIYLLSRKQRLIGALSTFLPGFVHQQAFLTPLILLSRILNKRYVVFVVLTLLPLGLLLMGFTFQAYTQILSYQDAPFVKSLIAQGLRAYIAIGNSGAYEKIRMMPYSYLPLILMMVYFAKDVFSTNNELYRYCAMSLVISCWLAWLCAGWQEPQARFFEYFALPTVLLVGNFRNSLLSNLGVIVVTVVFVVRYNILHPLLTG